MSAPEKIYRHATASKNLFQEAIYADHPWPEDNPVEYIRADLHEAAMAALKAENEARDFEMQVLKEAYGVWNKKYAELLAEKNELRADLHASIAVREEFQLGGNRMAESLRFAKEEIEDLRAEVAALRRENERYEFLRERASDESWPEWCTWEMLGEAEGAEWDALVDRLMEEY